MRVLDMHGARLHPGTHVLDRWLPHEPYGVVSRFIDRALGSPLVEVRWEDATDCFETEPVGPDAFRCLDVKIRSRRKTPPNVVQSN